MTDLDFDELDKAVNSLMKGAPVKKEPGLTDEQTLTIKPTLPEDGRPPLESLNTAIANTTLPEASTPSIPTREEPVNTPVSQPSVASRRGRFMDMVRPAASSSSATPMSRSASRQGLTVEPKGPLVTDIKPVTTSQVTPTSPTSPPISATSVPTPETTQPESQQKTDWPDPLEMVDYESTSPTETKKSNSLDEDELAKGISTLQSDNEPLSSPFLADTKVEKRPLGGGLLSTTPTDSQPEPDLEPSQERDDTHGDQLPANPADSRPELPEELSTDLMALESDANTIAVPLNEVKSDVIAQTVRTAETGVEMEQPEPPVTVEDKPMVEKEVVAEIPKHTVVHTQPVAPDHTLPAGPISIPQQYREEPSTGDQNNGAIYDTDAYHQPLAHPKKKKSGWIWVMWTALFLALGAAGGAALYFLGVF